MNDLRINGQKFGGKLRLHLAIEKLKFLKGNDRKDIFKWIQNSTDEVFITKDQAGRIPLLLAIERIGYYGHDAQDIILQLIERTPEKFFTSHDYFPFHSPLSLFLQRAHLNKRYRFFDQLDKIIIAFLKNILPNMLNKLEDKYSDYPPLFEVIVNLYKFEDHFDQIISNLFETFPIKMFTVQGYQDKTALHHLMNIYHKDFNSKIARLQLLIDQFTQDAFYVPDHDGQTPLHLMVESFGMYSQLDDFEKLLFSKLLDRFPFEAFTLQDNEGSTPLHSIIKMAKHLNAEGQQMVLMLLADNLPKILSLKDGHGRTPLHLTLIHAKDFIRDVEKIMIHLLEQSPDDFFIHQENQSETVLYLGIRHAISCENLLFEIVKRSPRENYRIKTQSGNSPLYLVLNTIFQSNWVLSDHQIKLITNLLTHFPPESYDDQDNEGRTPLHIMMEKFFESKNHRCTNEIFQIIATHSAQSYHIQDNKGRTPLHVLLERLAFRNHSFTDQQILSFKKQGIKSSPTQVFSTQNHLGAIPLHLLIQNAYDLTSDCQEVLLEAIGKTPDEAFLLQNKFGRTALQLVKEKLQYKWHLQTARSQRILLSIISKAPTCCGTEDLSFIGQKCGIDFKNQLASIIYRFRLKQSELALIILSNRLFPKTDNTRNLSMLPPEVWKQIHDKHLDENLTQLNPAESEQTIDRQSSNFFYA